MDSLQLSGFLLENSEGEQRESEPPPQWPNLSVIFVSDSAFMDQKYGHWTMTGSVFGHLMRNRDDLCIIVIQGCAKKKKNNHS